MLSEKYPLYRGQEIIFTNNNKQLYGIIREDFMEVPLPKNYITAVLEDTEGDSFIMSAFRCKLYIN